MPGIVAVAGCDAARFAELESAFRSIWGTAERLDVAGGAIAAHAHSPARATAVGPDGSAIAVDGERALYDALAAGRQLLAVDGAGPGLAFDGTGNVVAVTPDGVWHAAVDWTGTFPLYYAHRAGTLYLASHLRPLVSMLGADPDLVAVLEFLREGYTVGGRSLVAGVSRLLPGQSLRYDPVRDALAISETSELWAGIDPRDEPRADAAEAGWRALVAAVNGELPQSGRTALMLSGGWDSRTLLAAARERRAPEMLLGYSHGDLASRELRLVAALAAEADIALHAEPIDARVYEPARLRAGFARTENVVFPHWHRAGAVLRDAGASCVAAGVYGEVFGGHYGRAMTLAGRRKIIAVGRTLVGQSDDVALSPAQALAAAREHFRVGTVARPWYLAEEVWRAALGHGGAAAIDADTDRALARLANRGVATMDQYIEAYITEHRGTQYINQQLLSCRAELDVALPFAARPMLAPASRTALVVKIHNALNQVALRRHAPALLEFPCAATLFPASAPLLLQEASRLVRRAFEEGQWRLHSATGGRVAAPRTGWVNFEFLRQGRALADVVDALEAPLWDRAALRRSVDAVASGAWTGSVHPLSDALMKMLTVDFTLREAR